MLVCIGWSSLPTDHHTRTLAVFLSPPSLPSQMTIATFEQFLMTEWSTYDTLIGKRTQGTWLSFEYWKKLAGMCVHVLGECFQEYQNGRKRSLPLEPNCAVYRRNGKQQKVRSIATCHHGGPGGAFFITNLPCWWLWKWSHTGGELTNFDSKAKSVHRAWWRNRQRMTVEEKSPLICFKFGSFNHFSIDSPKKELKKYPKTMKTKKRWFWFYLKKKVAKVLQKALCVRHNQDQIAWG